MPVGESSHSLSSSSSSSSSSTAAAAAVGTETGDEELPLAAAVSASNESVIYRMKGILHVTDADRLYVLQAVYEVFDLQESSVAVASEDDRTGGKSLIVVIGHGIDGDSLEKAFNQTIVY